ncbi:hypothetical protein H671_3g8582 [Cricetulus griseus]|uniref:Uncharacterized protein n=1 Tax=Cricetulus griseus TaxID=10029 RepID=A0A061II94_CRIGR|nr:hypothetical protein H671_3g8582 [Cricetulus griseus]
MPSAYETYELMAQQTQENLSSISLIPTVPVECMCPLNALVKTVLVISWLDKDLKKKLRKNRTARNRF